MSVATDSYPIEPRAPILASEDRSTGFTAANGRSSSRNNSTNSNDTGNTDDSSSDSASSTGKRKQPTTPASSHSPKRRRFSSSQTQGKPAGPVRLDPKVPSAPVQAAPNGWALHYRQDSGASENNVMHTLTSGIAQSPRLTHALSTSPEQDQKSPILGTGGYQSLDGVHGKRASSAAKDQTPAQEGTDPQRKR